VLVLAKVQLLVDERRLELCLCRVGDDESGCSTGAKLAPRDTIDDLSGSLATTCHKTPMDDAQPLWLPSRIKVRRCGNMSPKRLPSLEYGGLTPFGLGHVPSLRMPPVQGRKRQAASGRRLGALTHSFAW